VERAALCPGVGRLHRAAGVPKAAELCPGRFLGIGLKAEELSCLDVPHLLI